MAARARAAASDTWARIRAVIRRIPRGSVASYGQIAALAGLPRQARLVGYALHASDDDTLPWHRVVNAEGRLSLERAMRASGVTQRLRLTREGVAFDGRGRVRMDEHRWSATPRASGKSPRRSTRRASDQ